MTQKRKATSTNLRGKSRLDELRKHLTPLQRELLNEFWQHYRKNAKWPLARTIHSQRSKQTVKECLRGLGGDIVLENQDSSPGRHYELTIIGVLLTDAGRDYFSMLTRYLEFLRKQYKEAPERLSFSDKDFRDGLGLSDEQVKILGELVRMGRLWSGGGHGPESWNVQAPDEVEDLPEKGSLDQALEGMLFRWFQASRPVSIEERQRQSPATSFFDPLKINAEVVPSDIPITVDALKRRYQVFVSSTYEDLKEERQHVLQALLETKCIPLGMELFPAASVEQWQLIRRVIEECDYYIVIVAGRYGSLSESGVGYTEMEFDYAVSMGKPVIGFYHKNPDSLPGSKLEKTDAGRERLKAFADKVKKKLCRPWNSPAELGSAVKSAVLHELEFNPRPGWIRADAVLDSDAVEKLKQKIADLEERLKKRKVPPTTTFPDGAESVVLNIAVHDYVDPELPEGKTWQDIEIEYKITWDKLLLLVKDELLQETSLSGIRKAVASHLAKHLYSERLQNFGKKYPEFKCSIALSQVDVVLKTLMARKLVTLRVVDNGFDQETFWKFTPKGLQYLAELQAVRSSG
ncbi:MAG: DUF4062 domain-containing protein [Verrucomicrobia bacterium]|nr:MAG: DUF4062 domain-containing protein [Verrucomicrobiota bacterium]